MLYNGFTDFPVNIGQPGCVLMVTYMWCWEAPREGDLIMRAFIGAIPVFDTNMAVHAYKMVTQDGDKLLGSAEDFRMLGGELLAPALECVKDIGVEPFALEQDFFVGISKYQLLIGMPLNMKIPPGQFVCLIDKDDLSDNAVFVKIGILKRNGYRLALEGIPDTLSMETAAKLFDYFLLSSESPNISEDIMKIRPFLKTVRLVITDVPDMSVFERYSRIPGVLLNGNFHSKPITKDFVEISPLKINALHLIKQINEEGFDLIEASKIIERDPALSISLLRFLSSVNPNRSKKIESIRSAVTILGQKEVKKWATVAISIGLGEDRPSEVTRLSLIRAKFAENLAGPFEMGLMAGTLFITGLFSLLDVVLQRPMSEAIKEVAATDDVKDALLHGKGPLGEVLALIYAYERADWHNASLIMVRKGIDIDVLTKAFLDSLFWYRQILDSIDESADDIEASEADETDGVE